jgi:hypothetical protein
MSDPTSRTTRITTAVVGVLVAGVIAVTALGVSRGGAPADGATPEPSDTATPVVATPTPTATAPLDDSARIQSGLTAEIVSMKAVQAKATQPGQVGGPAVSFTIKVTNTSGAKVDLSSTVVNVAYGVDEEPAYELDSDGIVFPASVAAKRSVTGTAVFTIPTAERAHVVVSLDTAAAPVVAFTGAAPR